VSVDSSRTLKLAFSFEFKDLYDTTALARLDARFLEYLDPVMREKLTGYRANPEALPAKEQSQLIIDVAPHLEDFIGELFGITHNLNVLRAHHSDLAPLYSVKRRFVQRKAITTIKAEQAAEFDPAALEARLTDFFGEPVTEMAFANHVNEWLEAEAEHPAALQVAAQYAAWATLTPQGKKKHQAGDLFKTPHKLDMQHLVPVEEIKVAGDAKAAQLPAHEWRHREGFHLTDRGMDLTHALDHAFYCIKCHNQGKDSCSTGLKEKTGEYKKSAFGVTLAGCPLDEKISEMNVVKGQGNPIGALAVVTIDNPMAAGTGHRICNDCMKSCTPSEAGPVDIPQVETRALKDVLDLPWGFEIYSLLTRWIPEFQSSGTEGTLRLQGVSGGTRSRQFTVAHHLMNDGHTVWASTG
jgi:hypothetical protein